MTYIEKAAKFKELAYRENKRPDYIKWRSRDELAAYLERWGGRPHQDRQEETPRLPSFRLAGLSE